MLVSIVVPTFNEAGNVERCLSMLQPVRGGDLEIIVVDGGSRDDTVGKAERWADKIIVGKSGRALQMNLGARAAGGKLLLFLHADTVLPKNFSTALDSWKKKLPRWGFFSVRLSGDSWVFRIIEKCINKRSKISAVATGDQGIFVQRQLFLALGLFKEWPLMEDVELSKRLRNMYRPERLSYSVNTSSRRWEKMGVGRTILLMWRLRLLFFLGVSPEKLASAYRQAD